MSWHWCRFIDGFEGGPCDSVVLEHSLYGAVFLFGDANSLINGSRIILVTGHYVMDSDRYKGLRWPFGLFGFY